MHPRIAERAREPRYSIPEAAGFVGRPPSTIRRWALGNRRMYEGVRRIDEPLISVDGNSASSYPVSFLNLLELRFLASYRSRVPLQAIRAALDFAAAQLDVDRPLLTVQFKTQGKALFLRFADTEAAGEHVVNASHRGQLVWPSTLEGLFEAVEYDSAEHAAFRWWPLGTSVPVMIDTRLNGGQPSTALSGVRTVAIAARRREGLEPTAIAEDVAASEVEVEAALRFERLPLAA
jgi:uncharacterized protein (DUF433 family)